MPFAPFTLEDFRAWPTGAGNDVGAYSGTGWSNTISAAGAPRVVADTQFNSGKALEYFQSMVGAGQYAIPPQGVLSRTYSWNQRRTLDNGGNYPDRLEGTGMRWDFGVAGVWFRIVANTTALGLGNQYLLQKQEGATGTFATIASTPNNVFSGVKTGMAIVWDPTGGSLRWFVNDPVTPIYNGSLPAALGLEPVALTVGRMSTGPAAGTCHIGDVWFFSDGAWPGACEVRSAFPANNLALQDWTPVGGSGADCIDQVFSSAPASYIEATASGQVSQFTCPVNNSNVVTVYSASHEYYAARTEVSLIDMNGQIGDSVSFDDGATTNPPQTTYQRFADYYDQTNPNTGVSWTVGDMSNNEVGYERTS